MNKISLPNRFLTASSGVVLPSPQSVVVTNGSTSVHINTPSSSNYKNHLKQYEFKDKSSLVYTIHCKLNAK